MQCASCGGDFQSANFCPHCAKPAMQAKQRPPTPPIPPPPTPPVANASNPARPATPAPPATARPGNTPHGTPASNYPESAVHKSGGSKALRFTVGVILLIAAGIFFINMDSSDSPGGNSNNEDVTVVDTENKTENFSIDESCAEVRNDYMAADPGSDQERWALEAAEEVCFGQ